ncbi:MAG: hypothetical protein AAF800_10475 [Planctomycetota bacterium]
MLAVLVSGGVGCQGPAVVAAAIAGGEKVEAAYRLPDAATLVMVDDPQNLLSNPRLARQVATTAIHYMTFHEALGSAEFIDPRRLNRLEAELDRQWEQTPIDEVARRLGAQQVVYARVESVTMHVADTLYRPEATLEVKVLATPSGDDAATSRLWPEAPVLGTADGEPAAPGHRVRVGLDYVSRDSRFVGDATPDDLARRLADEAGLHLGRLFYDWKRPEPGSTL